MRPVQTLSNPYVFRENLCTHQPNVFVDRLYPSVGLWYKEFRVDDLLDRKDYPVLDSEPNSRAVATVR